MTEPKILTEWADALIEVETIECTTDQWNFPHARNMPWAKDGVCSICDNDVSMVRVGPDRPCVYSHIGEPHTRGLAWYRINADDLTELAGEPND